MSPTRDLRTAFVVGLALVAMTLKLAIAYNTIGSNDAVFFYGFARVLSEHSLQWTYEHSRYFNHPPLTAYFLRGIFLVTEQRSCQGTNWDVEAKAAPRPRLQGAPNGPLPATNLDRDAHPTPAS